MENISNVVKVDGMVLVSNNWEMLPNGVDVGISRFFSCSKVNNRTHKGLLKVECDGYLIQFCAWRSNDARDRDPSLLYNTGVLVYPNKAKRRFLERSKQRNRKGNDGLNDQFFSKEKLSEIKSCYYAAIDHAIQINRGTATSNEWRTNHAGCSSLAGGHGSCESCGDTRYVTVHGEDVHSFGTAFQDEFNLRLDDCKAKLMVTKFGQNSPWENYRRVMKLFNLQHADQVIIHMARDFEQKEMCLFWKDLPARNGIDEKSDKTKFCNLMTGGHCSTYLNFQNSPEYKESQKRAEVHAAHVKLYSSFLKELHRNEKRWKGANVERCLCNVKGLNANDMYKRGLLDPEELLAWIKAIRTGREDVEYCDYTTARFEAVLCKNYGDNTECTKSILGEFKRHFNETYGTAVLQQYLSSFPMDQFLAQVDTVLIPALNTVEPVVTNHVEEKKKSQVLSAIPKYRDLVLAVVSEMIISFAVYGRLNYFAPSYNMDRFPNDLVTELQLRYTNQLKNPEVFYGLNGVAFVKVVDSAVGKKVLEFTGSSESVLKRGLLWKNLEKEGVAVNDIQKIPVALDSIYKKRQNEGEDYQHEINDLIVPHFCVALQYYAENQVLGSRAYTAEQLCNHLQLLMLEGEVDFVNSLEFVEHFFENPEENEQVALAYLARELQFEIGNKGNKRTNIRHVLARAIDEDLFTSDRLALIYPHSLSGRGRYSVILPFFGNKQDSFTISSSGNLQERNRKIKAFYAQMCRDLPNPPDPVYVQKVWRILVERREDGSLEKIEDVIERAKY